MKIVVDTHVAISGTFFGGAPRRVVEAIGKKEIKACHALFDLEDFHGLHPVKINGRYYLEFSGPTLLQKNSIHELENEYKTCETIGKSEITYYFCIKNTDMKSGSVSEIYNPLCSLFWKTNSLS